MVLEGSFQISSITIVNILVIAMAGVGIVVVGYLFQVAFFRSIRGRSGTQSSESETMTNCPACGARISADQENCDYCGESVTGRV